MVSLRQRKKVSYSTYAAFADLDLSEGEGQNGSTPNLAPADEDEDSSGGSEEFAEIKGTAKKGKKGKEKGKGKSKVSASRSYRPERDGDNNSSDDFLGDVIEEDEEEEGEGEMEERVEGSRSIKRLNKATGKRKRATSAVSRDFIDSDGGSDANGVSGDDGDLKPLIDSLAASGRAGRRRAGKPDDGLGENGDDTKTEGQVQIYKIKFPRLGISKPEMLSSNYPLHSLGATTLSAEPSLSRSSSLEHHRLPSDIEALQSMRRMIWFKHLNYIPLEIPWQFWEGEAWYPETYKSKRSGEGRSLNSVKMEQSVEDSSWPKRRWDVDMGLCQVGRYAAKDVEHITYQQAIKEHLPRPARPGIHLQVGVGENRRTVTTELLKSFANDPNHPRQAQMFDAGGPIIGLDWCPMSEEESSKRGFKQYLAVAAEDQVDDDNPRIGPAGHGGAVQVWSLAPDPAESEKTKMECEMVVCFDDFQVMESKWMPLGGSDSLDNNTSARMSKLGILSVLLEDGTVHIVAIPDPTSCRPKSKSKNKQSQEKQPIFVKLPTLLTLSVDTGIGLCMDWASGSRLALGMSDGTIVIWDNLNEAIKSNTRLARGPAPSHYIPTHTSAVRDIAWFRAPMVDSTGEARFDLPPSLICSSGWDGDVRLTDLRDPGNSVAIEKFMRGSPVLAFSGYHDTLWRSDSEYWVTLTRVRPNSLLSEARLISHAGPISAIAASDYHGLIASGGADGQLRWANGIKGFAKAPKQKIAQCAVYALHFNSNTKEYRIVDNFGPELTHLDSKVADRTGQGTMTSTGLRGKGAARENSVGWSPTVKVNKISWNSACGIGRAGLLASGTACGLGRIDFMDGRFQKDTEVSRVDQSIELS